jgi:16S rRNA (adenine1518-N6/adenine1519-N6)-dimethyltransferase
VSLAKKKFGQNFITDTNLIKKIVNSSMDASLCIEVGPGRGALTNYLCDKYDSVIAYEIDKDMNTYLKILEDTKGNLNIIYQDFLSVSLDIPSSSVMVSNVPYYITTQIILKFLEERNLVSATLMFQK